MGRECWLRIEVKVRLALWKNGREAGRRRGEVQEAGGQRVRLWVGRLWQRSWGEGRERWARGQGSSQGRATGACIQALCYAVLCRAVPCCALPCCALGTPMQAHAGPAQARHSLRAHEVPAHAGLLLLQNSVQLAGACRRGAGGTQNGTVDSSSGNFVFNPLSSPEKFSAHNKVFLFPQFFSPSAHPPCSCAGPLRRASRCRWAGCWQTHWPRWPARPRSTPSRPPHPRPPPAAQRGAVQHGHSAARSAAWAQRSLQRSRAQCSTQRSRARAVGALVSRCAAARHQHARFRFSQKRQRGEEPSQKGASSAGSLFPPAHQANNPRPSPGASLRLIPRPAIPPPRTSTVRSTIDTLLPSSSLFIGFKPLNWATQ